jgi:enoyl-CoA hydratase/carnithine racemase
MTGMGDVHSALSDGVLELTLARPAKKNAVTGAMYAALAAALETADADPAVRCVLIAAQGADFCAGNDLQDFLGAGVSALDAGGPTLRFLHALAALETPLVAAVQGRAVGVGATLLLHCDLVVAAPDASLILPFVKLGLTPEAGSSLLLPAQVGQRVAAEMVLLGRPMVAERALMLGLINQIDADPLGAARAMAQEAAAQPPGAVRAAKRLLRAPPEDLHQRIDREAQVFLGQLATPDFQARAMAFFAKG